MLNPDFWLDEELATVSAQARLLYMGLWGICDDNYATLPNRPGWIKIQVFPYESVSIPPLLAELEGIGKIIKFPAEGSEWWYIKNFHKHQKVEKPSRPKYPKYVNTPRLLPDSSETSRRKGSKEVKEGSKGDFEKEDSNAKPKKGKELTTKESLERIASIRETLGRKNL